MSTILIRCLGWWWAHRTKPSPRPTTDDLWVFVTTCELPRCLCEVSTFQPHHCWENWRHAWEEVRCKSHPVLHPINFCATWSYAFLLPACWPNYDTSEDINSWWSGPAWPICIRVSFNQIDRVLRFHALQRFFNVMFFCPSILKATFLLYFR